MLLFSYLSRCIHHQHAMLKKEYRYCAQVTEVIPQLLVVCPHEHLGLIFFTDKVTDAFVGGNNSPGVLAGFFDNFFSLV